jgi:hypothetical protein
MRIYRFNLETGTYLGEDFADEVPRRRGGYQIPPDATAIAPPSIEKGQILIFNSQEQRWEVHQPPLSKAAPAGWNRSPFEAFENRSNLNLIHFSQGR